MLIRRLRRGTSEQAALAVSRFFFLFFFLLLLLLPRFLVLLVRLCPLLYPRYAFSCLASGEEPTELSRLRTSI